MCRIRRLRKRSRSSWGEEEGGADAAIENGRRKSSSWPVSEGIVILLTKFLTKIPTSHEENRLTGKIWWTGKIGQNLTSKAHLITT